MKPKFQPFSLAQIKPKGWILNQLRRDLEIGFASRLDYLTERASHDLFTHRIASSQDQLAWWDSETRGNWLWGYVMMAYLANHPDHIARVRGLMEELLATQDEDGYIGIYAPQWRYQHPAGENGELWGQSRALLPMLAYYEFSHDDRYLQAVERAVHLTMQHYDNNHQFFQKTDDLRVNITGLTHGLCYMDVVEWLYRITQNPAYREFGIWFLEDFNQMAIPFANDDLSIANLSDPHRPMSGHAVHTVEHVRALIWGTFASEKPEYRQALDTALTKLCLYQTPSGAVVGDESIHGLPMPDIGYEYCTLTELLMSINSACEHLGEARFGDMVETIAFNAGQGARLSNGKGISYLTSDTRLSANHIRPDSYSYLHGHGGRFKVSPTHEDVACCCNPNSVRFMPHYISRMWLRHDDGVMVMLYGASELTTTIHDVPITLVQQTQYPFSNLVTILFDPAQAIEFTLMLRIPAWSKEKVGIYVHDDETQIAIKEGYYHIRKLWSKGDKITITFAPNIRLIPYPNDEYSLHYGALQFVLPIPHQITPIKNYPIADFHDYDITPQQIGDAYCIPILDESLPNYGLSVKEIADANHDFPWDAPPIQLQGENLSLIPFGASILRRASFPVKK